MLFCLVRLRLNLPLPPCPLTSSPDLLALSSLALIGSEKTIGSHKREKPLGLFVSPFTVRREKWPDVVRFPLKNELTIPR